MCAFDISRNQAKEFAVACFDEIISEVAAAEKHGKELTNDESESKDRTDRAA